MARISDRPANAEVSVRDNNVDQALRVLKKKLQRDGFFGEVKKRQHHVSKGEQRRIDKAKGVSRAFKAEVARVAKDEGVSKTEAKKIVKDRRNGRSPG